MHHPKKCNELLVIRSVERDIVFDANCRLKPGHDGPHMELFKNEEVAAKIEWIMSTNEDIRNKFISDWKDKIKKEEK